MGSILDIYNRCTALPMGKSLFSRLLCFKAPYFRTIRPKFMALGPGTSRIAMKKRRAVTNHIGSVHAIAMCNLAELAAGTAVDAGIAKELRWIPRGMTVSYDKVARSDLTAFCKIDPSRLARPGDCTVEVPVTNRDGEVVFRAHISMYLSLKKPQ